MPSALKFEIGQKIGMLKILGSGRLGKSRERYWRVQCDCGTIKEVQGRHLKSGNTVSCGCRKFKHGNSRRRNKTAEYETWCRMIRRCENADDPCYGGRGISVCDRWKESFKNFLDDMGKRPNGRSIDRINNSKGYSPDNCRWATPKQQARNTRRNRLLECRGEIKPLSAWANESPVNVSTIFKRLKLNWDVESAIFRPKRSAHKATAALWRSNIYQ